MTTKQVQEQLQVALRALQQMSTKRDMDNLARFGITATNPVGVSMSNIQLLAKRLGRSHELAETLWETECYEARLLTSFVDVPERVTSAQMDRWCRDFDNWALPDTLCFKLWDRTPHAWAKVAKWGDKREEFIKRAAFAMIASLAAHDKSATDQQFIECLPLIERAATDDRNFVKKGVSWALRALGRRNAVLNDEAVIVSRRLSESDAPAARWIGRGAFKELTTVTIRK